jgi:cytidylate kinase
MPISQLIEKQRAMWEMKRRLEHPETAPGRFAQDGVSYGPCLLISRECGSGGKAVAKLAGQALGWEVYDREIVNQISELAHVREKLVESVDEKTRTAWETAWRQILFPDDVNCEHYLRCLRSIVLALGHHGDVILLGRGAQCILPKECALRARLVAPFDKRARRIAEVEKLPIADAQSRVRALDAERANFVRKYFGSNSALPLDYDIVINTDELGFEGAANVLLEALRIKLGVTVPKRA